MTTTSPHLRNGVITLVGQWGKYVIQVASIVILARVLSPADFGAFAIVTVFAGVALILSDFGLYLAAVRAPDLTQAQKSNLFWLNTAIGSGLWLTLALASLAVAPIYGNPQLVGLISVAGAAAALAGIAVQFRAELARNGRFRSLATMDVTSQLVALIVAVTAALAGAGPWALVAQLVVAQLGILAVSAIASRWRPNRPRRTGGMRELVAFGSKTLGTQVLNYISSNVDNLAIGYVWGANTVGVYSRAYQLAAIPIQQMATPLSRVAIPALARSAGEAGFAASVRRLQLMFAYTVVGVALLVAAAPTSVLELVLGPQWVSGALFLRLLAIAGAIQAVGYVHYWIFAAKNRMGLLLLLEGISRALMVALILVLVPFGAEYVAVALLAGQLAIWLLVGIAGLHRVDIRFIDLLRVSIRPVLLWIFAAVAGSFLEAALRGMGMPPIVCVLAVMAVFAGGAGLSQVVPGYRTDIRGLVDTVRTARRGPK